MKLSLKNLKLARKAVQKGFTLIELAIVGLFLGLLAVFAITQFSGSATDTTRANGLYEASSKLGDNWALIAQQCSIPSDVTATAVSAGTASTTAGKNLSLLVGNASAAASYTSCVSQSGVRPLTGLTTGGQGAESVQGYATTLANTTVGGRNAMAITFANVPDNVIIPLYNKYSSVSGASTATALGTSDTTDNQIQFGTATGGKRNLTIVRSL